MVVAAHLGELQTKYEAIQQAQEFATIGRLLLAGGGLVRGARDVASQPGVSARVRSFNAPNASDALVRRSNVPRLGLASRGIYRRRLSLRCQRSKRIWRVRSRNMPPTRPSKPWASTSSVFCTEAGNSGRAHHPLRGPRRSDRRY